MDLEIEVPRIKTKISGIWESPKGARFALILAHGAGAGMRHPGMANLAGALHARGIATLRFQFAYMEHGRKRPDSPETAGWAIVAASEKCASLTDLPRFAGGKSFGGRMTTMAAVRGILPEISGIACFGFPLHRAKEPATERAEHLANLAVPTLFIQGTRDVLADLTLVKEVVARYRTVIEIHVVEGADHSFSVLKSSGRTPALVLDEVGAAAAKFFSKLTRY